MLGSMIRMGAPPGAQHCSNTAATKAKHQGCPSSQRTQNADCHKNLCSGLRPLFIVISGCALIWHSNEQTARFCSEAKREEDSTQRSLKTPQSATDGRGCHKATSLSSCRLCKNQCSAHRRCARQRCGGQPATGTSLSELTKSCKDPGSTSDEPVGTRALLCKSALTVHAPIPRCEFAVSLKPARRPSHQQHLPPPVAAQ